jgi:hypothetical protein
MAQGDDEIKLPQEQLEALFATIERFERRRKLLALGYILAAVLLIVLQLAAFVIAARVPPGTFIAWVFLVPFAVVGAILWGIGRLARKKPQVGAADPPRRS